MRSYENRSNPANDAAVLEAEYPIELTGETVAQAVQRANFDSHHANFVWAFEDGARPTGGRTLKLARIDRWVQPLTARLMVVLHHPYRMASVHETLAFAAAYPAEQLVAPIACLGATSVGPDQSIVFPVLCEFKGYRRLGFGWFGGELVPSARILIVPKTDADHNDEMVLAAHLARVVT